MEKWCPYSTIWVKNIVVIIHIYGARAVLQLFVITKTPNMNNVKYILARINQYTPWKMKSLYGEKYIPTLLDGRKMLWLLFIFMELEPL